MEKWIRTYYPIRCPDDEDYAAFIRVLAPTLEACPMRVCGFCLMPNHWHPLLWPE